MATSRWARAVLRIVSRVVPRGERDEWLREWEAELDHVAGAGTIETRAPRAALGRLVAAAEDALRLRLGRSRGGSSAGVVGDVRFAARALARSPLFTAAVIVTLGLGIGANAALFTVVDGVLLEPLPYPESNRLVQLLSEREGRAGTSISTPDFDDLRELSRTVEHLSLRVWGSPTYQADRPMVLTGASVSAGYFRLFGTTPHLGRYFVPDDDAQGVTPSVVLSYGVWQRVFGGDPGLVGETLTFDGRPYVVVGVAEPGLRDPVADVEIWSSRPAWIEAEQRGQGWLQVFGRLAPHATFESATAELDALSQDLARQHPVSNADRTFGVASLQQRHAEPIRPALVVLLAAVGLVLLITCANVANLILVRSAGRARELAVRISLGAGKGRLAGQLLVEGLLLAAIGGATGLALAIGATRGLVALGAPGVPRLAELHVDGTVLLFTMLVSCVTGIVFGLVPLLQLSGADPARVLREGGRSGEGRRARRVRRALVAAELAVSAVLLVGAGLLVRSLNRIAQVDTGVRTEGVLTFQVRPPQEAFPTPADLRVFHERLRMSIARMPGVEAVGGVNALPLTGLGGWYGFFREDAPPPAPGETPLAGVRMVEPGYFESVG
ncbi:MAG: ABC transporter permease, partial [Longimicrobiales bacterium]